MSSAVRQLMGPGIVAAATIDGNTHWSCPGLGKISLHSGNQSGHKPEPLATSIHSFFDIYALIRPGQVLKDKYTRIPSCFSFQSHLAGWIFDMIVFLWLDNFGIPHGPLKPFRVFHTLFYPTWSLPFSYRGFCGCSATGHFLENRHDSTHGRLHFPGDTAEQSFGACL